MESLIKINRWNKSQKFNPHKIKKTPIIETLIIKLK